MGGQALSSCVNAYSTLPDDLPSLARKMRKTQFLGIMSERQGQICEAAEIAETLHPGESLDDLTRIHVLARRVIYQLKSLNPGMEVPLRNHRGQGYQLIVE
jgi:hypothetical protein